MNTKIKVQNTPFYKRRVGGQSLPAPVNPKDDTLLELGSLKQYGIITTSPVSKNANTILAQKKPDGNLRQLDLLRKFISLIADIYTNNSHPVSTLTDAA